MVDIYMNTDRLTQLHQRRIEHLTWLHADGALRIESRLVDTKGYDTTIGFGRYLPVGKAVHDMGIIVTVEQDWRIRDINLQMFATPFDSCPGVIQAFESLRGESMGAGWNSLLSERFGGAGGCRHLVDMLRAMATVVFQARHRGGDWMESAINDFTDSCYAFRSDGEVVPRLLEEVLKRASNEP